MGSAPGRLSLTAAVLWGAGKVAYRDLLVYVKVWMRFTSAWMSYMHKCPAKLIFFINMLINKYKSYRTQTWIKEITLIELKFGECLHVLD
jgi:hypothetical protein